MHKHTIILVAYSECRAGLTPETPPLMLQFRNVPVGVEQIAGLSDQDMTPMNIVKIMREEACAVLRIPGVNKQKVSHLSEPA